MPKHPSNSKQAQGKQQSTVTMNISVPMDVYKKICDECANLGLSRSGYVTMTLKQKWQADEVTANLPEVLSVFSRLMDKMDEQEEKNR